MINGKPLKSLWAIEFLESDEMTWVKSMSSSPGGLSLCEALRQFDRRMYLNRSIDFALRAAIIPIRYKYRLRNMLTGEELHEGDL